MTSTRTLTDEYLSRLDRAAHALPRSAREDLVDEIRGHLAAGLSADASETDVRNLLDELGPPAAIVAAAQPDLVPTRRGARETFALILLVTGFPPVIGWIVGVGLLLSSPLWSGRQKLLGVLVWPGGYVGALLASGLVASWMPTGSAPTAASTSASATAGATAAGATSPGTAAVFVILAVAPLLVAVYLYRAAGRRES